MGFISWLKGVAAKLISKKEVESALRINTALSDEMSDAISLWSQMYQDSPPWKSDTVQTLNLPAAISAKMARMVTVEAEMDISGSPRAGWLKSMSAPVWADIRNITEKALAKGGLVFKPYIEAWGISIDCVQADRFFPKAYDANGKVTGGVFIAQHTEGGTIYTRLEVHDFQNGTHTITNHAYRSNTTGYLGTPCSLSAVEDWASIQPETVIYNLDEPLFVYWKMPFANNVDDTSPLGVSVFARAVDTIKEIDRQYSRLIWEFESGERTIHASADLFRRDKDGKVELPKGKERTYRLVHDGIEDDKNLFQEFSPAFRDQSLLNGFNTLLRQMEQQCGLASGTFSDPQNIARTATELNFSHHDSYVTVADVQKSLETAFTRLLAAMDALATAGRLAPTGNYDVAFSWDDSIVNNPGERKAFFRQLTTAGQFPLWRYLVEYEGYTEEEAREIQAESSQRVGDPYA